MSAETEPTYFHCSGTSVAAGSILLPGNWGRMLRLYEAPPGTSISGNALREALLEQARMLYAPDKPSRLASLFVCRSLDEARAFRNRHQRTNLIYEVRPVRKDAAQFEGNYELAMAPYPVRYFEAMFDFSRRYWEEPPTENVELLLDCGAEVLRCIVD